MQRIFLTALIAAAVLVPCAASAEIVPAFGITIQSCVVNSNGAGLTNGVNIVYYSTHPSPATEIDFLVRYHGHAYVLTDRGTFTQNSQINHNIANSLVGRSWQGSKAKLCTVQRVLLENGKVLQ